MEKRRKTTYIAYFYNKDDKTYTYVCRNTMKIMKETKDPKFIRYKSNLYRGENNKIQLEFVSTGKNFGFRRKGDKSSNKSNHYRWESESTTHFANKDVLSKLDELTIKIDKNDVKLYIEYFETEKPVICNGSRYEVDLYIKLLKTEPANYYNEFNGEIWFELYHTCPVDEKQYLDFLAANLTLYEYKIPECLNVYQNITEEGLVKRKEFLTNFYKTKSIYGYLVTRSQELLKYLWYKKENNNYSFRYDGYVYTVFSNKYNGYSISINHSKFKKTKFISEYNNKKFASIDDAKNIAMIYAFKIYNGKNK